MTGTLHLLNDVKSIRGGYVDFAGNQGGKIVGEGTLTNGKVTFENVNYISELENNLLSISQICDKQFSTQFTDRECLILKPGFKIPEEWIIMRAPRVNDLYVMNMSTASTSSGSTQCFISRASERESVLWHRRMGHISLRKMNHLVYKNLVEGVNLRNFELFEECLDGKKGKKTRKNHPKKLVNSINLPFERLHMDVFGPINVKSIIGKLYCLVVTDDYSRFSWVMFLESKDETYGSLMVLFKKLETFLHKIVQVQNVDCQRYTPTIQRPGDSMLFDYESLWESFQLPEEESSEETLMMIYNQRLSENQEHVTKEPMSVSQNVLENVQSDDVPETVPVFDFNGDTDEEIIEVISPSISHDEENVTNLQTEVSVEPKTYKEALTEERLVNAMQEELMQFEKLGVWRLVDLPEDKKQINTKWVFMCKRDENGIIVRNKARLLVLGFNQREGIDYNEVYNEVIGIFLAFASWKGFKVYQLDAKSAFLNGKICEEVYVGQPSGYMSMI
ncbi:uncharacterized protein LOC143579489 [Bidens hawaiensis]|uniref:uncharacterized protein LOC143579489 n=1 Tax=Bidens hawaiensis TaxID=980011 RepID=UPI0040492CDD